MSFGKLKEKRDAFHTKEINTSPALGPGTYNPDKALKAKRRSATAPFLSSAKRDPLVPKSDAAFPGPGAYSIQDIETTTPKKTTQSNAFLSATDRFSMPKESLEKSPGPGAYNLSTEWVPRTSDVRHSAPSLTWQSGFVVPSIPNTQFGYDVLPNGELMRIPAPPMMTSQQAQPLPRPRSAGTNFARGSSRRMVFERSATAPGPGDYELALSPLTKKKNSFAASQKPRFNHKIASEVPGPGEYSPFEATTRSPPKHPLRGTTVKKKQKPIKPASTGPGPGYYSSSSLFPEKKSYSGAPFNSVARRFDYDNHNASDDKTNDAELSLPGPGAYETSPPTTANNAFSIANTSFGMQDRFPPLPNVDFPAPGQYVINDESHHMSYPMKKKQSHFFVSSTKRMSHAKPSITPAPGVYYRDDTLSHHGVTFTQATRKIELSAPPNIPGPGDYETTVVNKRTSPSRRASPPPFGVCDLRFKTPKT